MKLQIKKRGDSKVVVLPTHLLKFHDLKEGDWIDMGDIKKINRKDFNHVN
jgi:antitoxin component of MazEF toxin-antitoxin module